MVMLPIAHKVAGARRVRVLRSPSRTRHAGSAVALDNLSSGTDCVLHAW